MDQQWKLCFEKQVVTTHFSANSAMESVLHPQLLEGPAWALTPDWKCRNRIEGFTPSANAHLEGAAKAVLGNSVALTPARVQGRQAKLDASSPLPCPGSHPRPSLLPIPMEVCEFARVAVTKIPKPVA